LEPWSAERKGISIYFTPFILQIRIPRPRREQPPQWELKPR
jgi:hypothetical protein